MGQYWQLFDLDRRRRIANLGKLGGALFSTSGHALILLLARPVPSQNPKELKLIKPYQRGSKGLFKLPLELLEEILTRVESRHDLLAFVMVNRTLYTVGLKHFQTALCNYEVPSAGHRLVCLGDYCRDDDLPPGALPSELEKAMAWSEYSGYDGDHRFYGWAQWRCTKISVFPYDRSSWQMAWEESDRSRGVRLSWKSYNTDALRDLLERHYPSDLEWVLCNLTKRVYVTTDAVSKLTGEKPRGPFFLQRLGFGEVLLCQICWSSDSSGTAVNYDGALHRGKWATDRFEITTTDRMSDLEPVPGGKEGEWEDVSDVVVGEMATIFRTEIGEDWRRYLPRPKKYSGYWSDDDDCYYDPYDFERAGMPI